MSHQENKLFAQGLLDRILPADPHERAYLESLVRSDYETCHPDDTFADLQRRARFTKEDSGLLYEWMAVAARRAAEHNEARQPDFNIAA